MPPSPPAAHPPLDENDPAAIQLHLEMLRFSKFRRLLFHFITGAPPPPPPGKLAAGKSVDAAAAAHGRKSFQM